VQLRDLTRLLGILEELGEDMGEYWEIVKRNPFAVHYGDSAFAAFEDPLGRTAIIGVLDALLSRVEAIASESFSPSLRAPPFSTSR